MKRFILLTVVVCMFMSAALCTGCSAKPKGAAVAGGKAPALNSEEEYFLDIPSALRGSVVQVAGWGSDTDFDKENVYANFTALTGIEIERVFVAQSEYISKLTSLIAAEQAPDVVTENGDFPRTLSILQPITKEATGIDVNDPFWDKQMMDIYAVGGKHYIVCGAKTGTNKAGGAVYFNRTTLEENGIKSPNEYVAENNWNLETFEKLLGQMKSSCGYGRAPASVDVDIWCSMFGAKQLEWSPETNKFTTTVASAQMNAALRTLLTMQDNGLVKIIAGHDDSIAHGTSGLQICGAYGLRCSPGWFYTMDMDDLGFEVLPKLNADDADYPYTIGLHGYGIVQGARNPMGAGYYLRYYLNGDNFDKTKLFKNEEAQALYQRLRDNADYSTATFYRGVRMIVDPLAASGTMLSLLTAGTAAQINVNLKSVENQIEAAVSEANLLIQDIIANN